MEEIRTKEKELLKRFKAQKIVRNKREYVKVPVESSYSFRMHFKTLFPEKELVLIYFNNEFEIWRVDLYE